MIRDAIAKLADRISLTEAESEAVMREIMEGQTTPAQIAAFLTALRLKGETVDEVVGAARAMREKAVKIRVDDPLVVDTCGTGGDRKGTFNISTTTAFVVAGAGVTVAKHGNRAASSKSGSADVLRALGVNIDVAPFVVEECVNDIGIGFLFAPVFHGAMKHAVGPRQEIGIRTLFNILGPLTNPAGASIQILGVYADPLADLMAQVLIKLGARHCFVVHGEDGLDEISVSGPTRFCEGKEGRISCYHLDPRDLGIPLAGLETIAGGSPDENAKILLAILGGERGPKRDIVLLNAAPPLVACGKAKDFAEGIALAAQSIDSGAAMDKLNQLKRRTASV
ncbi:MAG TPA: anthranilate phosphoribosyltransferase [Nitrospiria bacterium]|nr:anthranilate phosphoribosyltransferase [Nitrospiria bacterium]